MNFSRSTGYFSGLMVLGMTANNCSCTALHDHPHRLVNIASFGTGK